MPFLLLLFLTLVCLPEAKDRSPPPEWLGAWGSVALTWAGVAALVGFAAVLGPWTRRRMEHHPEEAAS